MMTKRKQTAGASRYEAAGKVVVCSHCNNNRFVWQEAMLNRRGSTLLNLDWVDRTGVALVCAKCSLIQWFLEEPQAVA